MARRADAVRSVGLCEFIGRRSVGAIGDLARGAAAEDAAEEAVAHRAVAVAGEDVAADFLEQRTVHLGDAALDRKSVVSGKSVSVRVDLGGRRIINKKNTQHI